MSTTEIRIGTLLTLSLVTSIGLAGEAAAQLQRVPPPQPANGPQAAGSPAPGAAAPNPALVPDCNKPRGPIRARLHRAHCKRCLEEKLLGFREEFNEWPLGAALYANCRAQVANGEAAMMTLYEYDFVGGTKTLNIRGMDKLREIKAMLPTNFAPVLVERTPARPTLAEARRAMVLSALSSGEFPVPAQRVMVGKPVPIGRGGGEATILSMNQMMGVMSGSGFGTAMGGAGGPSGFSSSNMSGGAMFGGGMGGGGMMGGGMMGGGMMVP